MKEAVIFGVTVVFLLGISTFIILLVLEIKDKKYRKEIDQMKKSYEKAIAEIKAVESKKDEIKVEADEKKRKIRTGNSYTNLVNGAEQLCDKP